MYVLDTLEIDRRSTFNGPDAVLHVSGGGKDSNTEVDRTRFKMSSQTCATLEHCMGRSATHLRNRFRCLRLQVHPTLRLEWGKVNR